MAKKKSVKKVNQRTAKPSENKYLPMLLIVLVSVLVVMGLLMWRNKMRAEKYEMMQKQVSQNLKPTQSYQLDTNNDGVYTNSQYKVKFSYPNKIFTNQTKYVDYLNTSGWAQQEWTGKSLVLGFTVGNKGSASPEYSHENLLNMKDDQTIGKQGLNYIQKLKNSNTVIPGSVLYYNELDNSTEVKSISYSYFFSWKDPSNGNSYSISLWSDNKKTLDDNRSLFIKIINSIELL
jgi:hypothetical protein